MLRHFNNNNNNNNNNLMKTVFLLMLPLVVSGQDVNSSCTKRRCLAEMLIAKGYTSQPQSQNCTHRMNMPFIEYQTLSVDTKRLRFNSRLQATMMWTDPELAWDKSVYPHDKVVLPVSKVWTPELSVTNAVKTSMKHSSRDVLVSSEGLVKHTVVINAQVGCDINLFKYPFSEDTCPIAIQAWASNGCGMELIMGKVKNIEGDRGDWNTVKVELHKQGKRDDRNYLLVHLSLRPFNPLLSILLPSILIIVVDLVSFALPLGGGERISFKITLVLSFIMFLIILNDLLSGDSKCSPIIRYHFCVCLIFLVLSMVAAMLLTGVAKDGTIRCCSRSKDKHLHNCDDKEEEGDAEAKSDTNVIKLESQVEESQCLQKVADFLEAMAAKDRVTQSCQNLANKMDNICFWTYLCLILIYSCTMVALACVNPCTVQHFGFWYDDDDK